MYNHSMERNLYHGSESIVKKPELGIGNPNNDYGLGFYCCQDKALGKQWGARKTGEGFVNHYTIRDDNLKILDLTKPPFDNVLYWVALLLHNHVLPERLKENFPKELDYLNEHYLIDVNDYDAVIGYRADDSYFYFPLAFVRSEIRLEALEEIFKLGSLGKQYVLLSKRAFGLIRFVDFEVTTPKDRDNYYTRKEEADKSFKELLEKERYKKGTRMRDIVSYD